MMLRLEFASDVLRAIATKHCNHALSFDFVAKVLPI
jgi:hypothetical protein